MLELLSIVIKALGEFKTHLGDEESLYWYRDDVWVIRYRGKKLYSIWNPTNDLLITKEQSSGRL